MQAFSPRLDATGLEHLQDWRRRQLSRAGSREQDGTHQQQQQDALHQPVGALQSPGPSTTVADLEHLTRELQQGLASLTQVRPSIIPGFGKSAKTPKISHTGASGYSSVSATYFGQDNVVPSQAV